MKTIVSGVVILITALLQTFGIELSIAEQEGLLNNIIIIGGALAVIYSRYTATRNLKTGGLLKPVAPGQPLEIGILHEAPGDPPVTIKD